MKAVCGCGELLHMARLKPVHRYPATNNPQIKELFRVLPHSPPLCREEEGKPPNVLSVLFDRPVFVEDAAFLDAGGGASYPGKVYSTGFGMSLEFHPGEKIAFDPEREYRVRLTVRDGKGRTASVEQEWRPKTATRH